MAFDEIIVLIISAIVGIGSIVALKFILKDKFPPILWAIPFSVGIGYTMMWFTSESDTVLLMLKDVLIWTFIVIMFYVNGKCLIKGSRSRAKSGKNLWHGIKSEYKNVVHTFKKKSKDDPEKNNGGDKNE